MDIKNMQESINTIMASNLSAEKKNKLVEEMLSAHVSRSSNSLKRKSSWTDQDTKYVYSTMFNEFGKSENWIHGLMVSKKFVSKLNAIASEVSRTEASIRAHINNAIAIANLTHSKKSQRNISNLVRLKSIAVNVGLISKETFMQSLHHGFTTGAVDIESLTTFMDMLDNEQQTSSSDVLAETQVKVSVKRKPVKHYAYSERVQLFKLIKAKLGTYNELCEIFNCNVFSGATVPNEIYTVFREVANELGTDRSALAIKGQVGIVSKFVKSTYTKKNATKAKLDTFDAAKEAGFINMELV